MLLKTVIGFAGIMACAACEPAVTAPAPESIWYSHAGCYGWCPRFEIHVSRDGRGTFEGLGYTAVHGKRAISVTKEQFDAFVNALQAARSVAKPFAMKDMMKIEEGSTCPPQAQYHTDDTGVFVEWAEKAGDVYYQAYFGCDSDRNKKLYDALDKAPDALGLAAMIGKPGPMTKP